MELRKRNSIHKAILLLVVVLVSVGFSVAFSRYQRHVWAQSKIIMLDSSAMRELFQIQLEELSENQAHKDKIEALRVRFQALRKRLNVPDDWVVHQVGDVVDGFIPPTPKKE